MKAALLGSLLLLLPGSRGADPLEFQNTQEDASGEGPTELSSESYPPPKAPPPTEATRDSGTGREEAEGGPMSVAAAERPKTTPSEAQTLWDARQRIALHEANLARSKKRTERPLISAVALLTLVLVGIVVLGSSDFFGKLSLANFRFPKDLQPQQVPAVVAELLATRSVVVFLAE